MQCMQSSLFLLKQAMLWRVIVHPYLVHYNYFINIYVMKLCKIYSISLKKYPFLCYSSGRWGKHIQLSEKDDEQCSQTYRTRNKHAHIFIVSWKHSYMLVLFSVKLKDNVTPLIVQRDLDFFWMNEQINFLLTKR